MFGLIALVGLINVLSALSMIIIEKSTQIGILKAQGMENIILRFIFIIQGGIISLFGSFFGGIIALIIILLQTKFMLLPIPSDIYFMDQIPFYFDFLTYLYITISVFIFQYFLHGYQLNTYQNLIQTRFLNIYELGKHNINIIFKIKKSACFCI